MNLYEVRNGYHGESYVRVYVWAESSEQALSMASNNFNLFGCRSDKQLEIYHLFAEDKEPFCTAPSDSGFGGGRILYPK